MKNFWQNLPRPFLALAPMEDVTDTVFRQIIISCARPDVFFTEFCNCDGLQSKGRDKVISRLKYANREHPIVAQIWGTNPENFLKTAQEIKELKFDGVDINMGCPEKSVTSHGGGGSLINNPNLAKEIILATKEGAKNLPVSIKTRIGFKTIQTEEWISFLLSLDLDALTLHGRTVAELSEVPTHWDEIGKAVQIKKQMGKKIVIIGNGDIQSYQEAVEKSQQYGVDGVMIGRGIFHNLWVFDKSQQEHSFSRKERMELLLKHVELFDNTWGKSKNFSILKKFFKIYIANFPGALKLRAKLMETENLEQVSQVILKIA